MRLSGIHSEGMVAAARGDILNIVNDLAGRIARATQVIFNEPVLRRVVRRPSVEYTTSEDDPAIVTLHLGHNNSETITISVFGDGEGEIKYEMSERLSKLLSLPPKASLSSLREVDKNLSEVAVAITQRL